MNKVNIALHAHPHFFRPNDGTQRDLHERIYTLFHRQPTLSKIVDNMYKKGVNICALSVCHTPTSGIDNGFEAYTKNLLSELGDQYHIHFSQESGVISLRSRRIQGEFFNSVLFYTQEVRAKYGERLADINVIGTTRIIQPLTDIDEVAHIAKEEGGFSIVCHPSAPRCSAGLEKAIEMVQGRRAVAGEYFNATDTPESNNKTMKRIDELGMKWPAVSDSHHYSQINAAYIEADEDLLYNFSIEKLKNVLLNGQFENKLGYIGKVSKHLNHTLPIFMSIPEHFIKNKASILKSLKKE